MADFKTIREAKDYFAGRIVAEAKHDGTPLTEVERKMLYFSETDWTLPGMLEINAEFEGGYNDSEYESKIAGLIRKIETRDADDEEEMRTWGQAAEKLSEGDNYLSIMLDPSFPPVGETARPPHDRLKLWLTAFGILFGVFGFLGLLNWAFGPKLWAFEDWLSHHNAGGLPGLLFIAAIALCWLARPRISAAFDRFLTRKKTGTHTG